MKTIFITIFEGQESKNILRTGVVNKILSNDPEVQVVLFVKTPDRRDYYKAEFHDPRIIYEVTPQYELGSLDKFFGKRKFHFLRTETTRLRAEIISEDRGKAYYYYTLFLHWFLAREFFVKTFRALDYLLVKDNYFDKYFEKYKPELIMLADVFEDFETSFLRSAKKHNVFSVNFVNSWDRVTARCIFRILADKFIVFNDIIKQELIETNYIDGKDIFVSGMPQYDMYFRPALISREEFFRNLGLNSDERVIVYSPIGGKFSDSDWDIMDLLYKLNGEKKFGDKVKILVRFPPNDFVKEEELKKRPHLLYQYPGVRFSTKRSIDWDMTKDELENLRSTLEYMSLIICYASSISVDTALFDKPIINIDFEIKKIDKLEKSATTWRRLGHYRKALDMGGIRLVKTEEELIDLVKKYLKDPSLDREGRMNLAKKQYQFSDAKSAERIADYVTSFLK
ncbi:MAG TPA: CDP-glycerol glycerophosphotransferase family protein [Candidatus Paceibacterota bacterium]